MAGINHLKWFASSGIANVMDQATFESDPATDSGYPAGILPSQKLNKALRNGSAGAAILGQLMQQVLQADVNDNGALNPLTVQLWRTAMSNHYFIDSGVASAISIVAPAGYTFPVPHAGLRITVRASAAPTGATNLNWMGNGNIAVRYSDGAVILKDDWGTGTLLDLEYDGTYWRFVAMTKQAILNMIQVIAPRLLADLILYVNPAGSNSNDGLTPATAFQTVQAAWDKAINIDLNGHGLTIQLANGTYTNATYCYGRVQGLTGGPGIIIQGNIVSPNLVAVSVTNAVCFMAGEASSVHIRGMTLQATGIKTDYNEVGVALVAVGGSTLAFSYIIFGPCGSTHINGYNSHIGVSGPGATYTVTGGAQIHAEVHGGFTNISQAVITFQNPVNFSLAFAYSLTGTVYTPGCTFINFANVSGKKYFATLNGTVISWTDNINYLPGTLAGSVERGGQYF